MRPPDLEPVSIVSEGKEQWRVMNPVLNWGVPFEGTLEDVDRFIQSRDVSREEAQIEPILDEHGRQRRYPNKA